MIIGVYSIKDALVGYDRVFTAPSKAVAIRIFGDACRDPGTVIAPLDTNCDPDVVDLPIPGNDDAIRSIHLFCNEMAAAMNEGKDALADETGAEVEPVTVEETEALIAEAVAEGEEFAFESEEA